MGIFSFIKNAGAKVFGIGKTDAEEAAEAAEAKRKGDWDRWTEKISVTYEFGKVKLKKKQNKH